LSFGRRLFARHDDPGNRLAHGYHVALVRLYSGKNSFRRGFNLDDRFVGFNFEQGLALGDGITFFFSPGEKLPVFLCHFQGGHYDIVGHDF
jgi:hypothetical protein